MVGPEVVIEIISSNLQTIDSQSPTTTPTPPTFPQSTGTNK
jgi:hypothetical protein